MAAQGLFAAPLRPVLSRCVLRALWGGCVAASAHTVEGHKGPCDTLPRAIQSAVPIAWRVTKGPVAHCHVPVPWGLPHPSKPAPQRHSAKGALAVPAKEAPWTPQQSSQQHTGRKQRAVLAPIPAPTALPKWVQHRASCAAPPLCLWTWQHFHMGQGQLPHSGGRRASRLLHLGPPGVSLRASFPERSHVHQTGRCRPRGPLGCSAGGWETAKQWPARGCLNQAWLTEHLSPVRGSLLGSVGIFGLKG